MGWLSEHDRWVAKLPEPIREAHRHAIRHRTELLASEQCGCFYCLEVYSPAEISNWTDSNDEGVGQTALCARCGLDSVIGNLAGFPLTREFLAAMKQYWF